MFDSQENAIGIIPPLFDRPNSDKGWPWVDILSNHARQFLDQGDEQWPRITVVTPSYNQGAFLEETIRSVLCQGYPNLEYMIIDGGSEDSSIEIIKRYAPWLNYWVSEPDKGQAAAINKGFARATGDLIGWLNSDDILLEGSLFWLADSFLKAPDSILTGDGILFNEMDNSRLQFRARKVDYESFGRKSWLFGVRWCQPGTYWPRALYEQIGPFEENFRYVFDWDWLLKAMKISPTYYIKRPMAQMRLHPSSKTVAEVESWHEEIALVNEKFWAGSAGDKNSWLLANHDISLAGTYLRSYHLDRSKAITYLWRAFRNTRRVFFSSKYWMLWVKLILPKSFIQVLRKIWWRISI